MRHGWIAGAALIATLAGPGIAAAGPDDGPIAATVARLLEAEEIRRRSRRPHRADRQRRAAVRQQPPVQPGPERSKGARIGRRIAGAAVGAVGGAFAGGYLGAAIDGDCGGCDDPGLQGLPDRLPGRRRRRRRAGRPLPVPLSGPSGRPEAADAVDQPIDLALGRVAGAPGADQAARAGRRAAPPPSTRRNRRATRRRRAPPGARRRRRHRGRRR